MFFFCNIISIVAYFRYLYALQIKKDLAEGLLLCSDATASLLASYILQGIDVQNLKLKK